MSAVFLCSTSRSHLSSIFNFFIELSTLKSGLSFYFVFPPKKEAFLSWLTPAVADLFHRTPINHVVGAEFKCPGHRGRGARRAAVMRIDAVSSRREWEKRLAVRQNTTSCPTDQTGAWWEASQTAWGVKCTACVCVSIREFRRSCCGVHICYHPRSDSGSVSPAIPSLVSCRGQRSA